MCVAAYVRMECRQKPNEDVGSAASAVGLRLGEQIINEFRASIGEKTVPLDIRPPNEAVKKVK